MASAVMAPDAAATYAYVGALVDELARAGVRHACLCPGSRSTPLAFALVEHPAITHWIHIDERSCAYFALGLARATGEPVAIACTSGTAAANFLPAVVEARYGRVPLIVLTADRPPELRDNGAAQTIDQIHLYGGNVKWFVEMALPEASETMVRYVRATAARAVATALGGSALGGPAGPVHLNVPLREPLVPPATEWHDGGFVPASATSTRRGGTRPGDAQGAQGARVVGGPAILPPSALKALADTLRAAPRGLIVCGPLADSDAVPHITGPGGLAAALGYPVLADPLSGARCGVPDRAPVLDAYDALLRTLPDDRAAGFVPEVVLRFGAIPTSKALQTFLDRAGAQILVDGRGGWQDPSARASEVIHADAAALCCQLVPLLREEYAARGDRRWLWGWLDADRRAHGAIMSYLNALDEPFEGKVFAELANLLPDCATLYAGNSMPVRDLDTFFPASERRIRFLSNRGANGIDGVVSSALGAAGGTAAGTGRGAAGAATAAHRDIDGSTRPLVLVIGDLSFYHDLNGLLAAKRYDIDATIVLLNNDGGGIFSFLPQAAYPQRFEELFGTPTGLDFRPAVEMYGCGFERVETWPAFRAAVSASLAARGVQVIEMRTDRARNVALHREIWRAVAEAAWCDG